MIGLHLHQVRCIQVAVSDYMSLVVAYSLLVAPYTKNLDLFVHPTTGEPYVITVGGDTPAVRIYHIKVDGVLEVGPTDATAVEYAAVPLPIPSSDLTAKHLSCVCHHTRT